MNIVDSFTQVNITKSKPFSPSSGYMAPEYALEGQFSIKSDVFSFGVLLLEIISGKRNNGFNQTGNIGNLLGYVSNMVFSFGIYTCHYSIMYFCQNNQQTDYNNYMFCVAVTSVCKYCFHSA